MQIYHISISHFRGIKTLTWNLAHPFVLLVGPGDSCKSTILEALELTLTARRQVSFSDADFHHCDTTRPIRIQVSVGGYPTEWKAANRYGLFQRGWNAKSGLRDEPEEGDIPVLTIQLAVDANLDPEWTIINDRQTEPRFLRSIDRDLLAVTRLGSYIDHHLSWSRYSLLSRLTGKIESLSAVLAGAQRDLRNKVAGAAMPELTAASQRAQALAAKLGVPCEGTLQPAIDPHAFTLGSGLLSLHEGSVPSRLRGTGSRRLLALALEKSCLDAGAIAVVDEIEHGLEPYRLRHILYELKNGLTAATGQVFLTTHAPAAIVECDVEDIFLIRNRGGDVTVRTIDDALQGIVRAQPEALLARRVVVCEGKTEVGFLRAMDHGWQNAGAQPFSRLGIVLVAGGGNTAAPMAAMDLRKLDYPVAYFGDSDVAITPSEAALRSGGCEVYLWENGLCIEQVVAQELPWSGIVEMLSIVEDPDIVRSRVMQYLKDVDLDRDPSLWQDTPVIREAIGKALKRSTKHDRGWFKNIEGGEFLGDLVLKFQSHLAPTCDLLAKLASLRTWVSRE